MKERRYQEQDIPPPLLRLFEPPYPISREEITTVRLYLEQNVLPPRESDALFDVAYAWEKEGIHGYNSRAQAAWRTETVPLDEPGIRRKIWHATQKRPAVGETTFWLNKAESLGMVLPRKYIAWCLRTAHTNTSLFYEKAAANPATDNQGKIAKALLYQSKVYEDIYTVIEGSLTER